MATNFNGITPPYGAKFMETDFNGNTVNNPIWYKFLVFQNKSLTLIQPSQGGTGVANNNSITLAGNFATAGNYNITLTCVNNTNVTLPTSGTLMQNTGANVSSASTFRSNINAAQSGINTDITALNSGTVTIGSGSLSVAGQITSTTLGSGLQLTSGTNARIGTVTLVAGTATVPNTSLTANTIIQLHPQAGITGYLYISARTNGTSFAVTSNNSSDAGVVGWILVEKL